CIGQTYVVPVIDTACGGVLNQSGTIKGFASITIKAANCNPPGYCANIAGCTGPSNSCTAGAPGCCTCSNDGDCGGARNSCIVKYITVQPLFIDCDLAQNATLCEGGSMTGSCTDCGTVYLRIVK